MLTIEPKLLASHLSGPYNNNFKAMRLISALLVVLSHCYGSKDPIAGVTNGLLSGSAIAMPTFFFLSGLLVTQSLETSPTRLNFLWKRFLRLYPAAVAAVILTACLLGPLVSTLPAGDYFTDHLFLRYLRTGLLTQIFYQLPGVFTHSPLGRSVNSSLWSLSLELKCYTGLFLLSFINPKIRYKLILIGVLVLLATATFYHQLEPFGKKLIHPTFVLHPYTGLTVFFLTGSLCYHYRRNITVHPWWIPVIVALGGIAAFFGFFQTALYLLLPAFNCCLAVTGTSLVARLTPKPDLSYGLYVWAFPMEQLVINYLHPTTPTLLFVFTLLLTIPLAVLSWYGVERPALNAKKAVGIK